MHEGDRADLAVEDQGGIGDRPATKRSDQQSVGSRVFEVLLLQPTQMTSPVWGTERTRSRGRGARRGGCVFGEVTRSSG